MAGVNGGMDGNSLVAALASDATQVGTTLIAANAAAKVTKANPNAATTLFLVVGGVAALIVVLILVRRK